MPVGFELVEELFGDVFRPSGLGQADEQRVGSGTDHEFKLREVTTEGVGVGAGHGFVRGFCCSVHEAVYGRLGEEGSDDTGQ